MRVLVVGGAGYVGSHTVVALKKAGHEPIILDNLVTGHREVAEILNVPLLEADLNQPESLYRAIGDTQFDAAMHFAAFALVGESVRSPNKYYQNNVCGTINLLDVMRSRGIQRMVFSSTCAVYGMPVRDRLTEDHPKAPINPYVHSKLMVEQILADHAKAYDFSYVALRYFNAAGANRDGIIGEDHDPESHLIPLCMMAATGVAGKLTVFGNDYNTPDGTCIRDYVHVEDLAKAHVLALDHLQSGGESLAMNVGTGKGYSVREVIQCVREVTDLPVPAEDGRRRDGDPTSLVAAGDLIQEKFGWYPEYRELQPIVETAWKWMRQGGRYGSQNKIGVTL